MHHDSLEEIRAELVRLLNDDCWQITKTAEADGRKILAAYDQFPTQLAVIDFVRERLVEGCKLHEVPLGEPPGSAGLGYVINYSDDKVSKLYIKLTIADEQAWLLSFHLSKHSR